MPLATTLRVAVAPLAMVWLAGWVVIVGGVAMATPLMVTSSKRQALVVPYDDVEREARYWVFVPGSKAETI